MTLFEYLSRLNDAEWNALAGIVIALCGMAWFLLIPIYFLIQDLMEWLYKRIQRPPIS